MNHFFILVRLNQPFQKNDTQDWKWLFSQMHFIFLNNLQIIFSLQPPQEPKSDLLLSRMFCEATWPFFFFSAHSSKQPQDKLCKTSWRTELGNFGVATCCQDEFCKMFVKKLAFPQIYIQVQWSIGHHPSDIENFTWKERESSDICIKEVSSCQKEWNTKKKVERFLQLEWGFLEGSLFFEILLMVKINFNHF